MKPSSSRRKQALHRVSNNLSDGTIFQAYSAKYGKILMKLPRDKIIELVLAWLENPITEPHLEWSSYDFDIPDEEDYDDQDQSRIHLQKKEQGIEILKEEYHELLQASISKKEIVQRIMLDHWARGFNMIQIADIDALCKCLWAATDLD